MTSAAAGAPFDRLDIALRETVALTHPLYIATDVDDSRLLGVIKALHSSLPAVETSRRVAGLVKARAVPYRETLEYSHRSDVAYEIALLTCPADTALTKYSRFQWSARLRLLKSGPYSARLGEAATVVAFEMERTRIKNGTLIGAPQLALTRHLLAEFYTAMDPSARVAGRHDWDPAWWPDDVLASQ